MCVCETECVCYWALGTSVSMRTADENPLKAPSDDSSVKGAVSGLGPLGLGSKNCKLSVNWLLVN